MTTHAMHTSSANVTIPDLVGRLTDDSKRLVRDEVRLGKLELGGGVQVAVRSALWLTAAFGLAVLALVALTVLLTVLIGRVALGRTWAGALITGGAEVIVGAWFVWHGTRTIKRTDFTLGATRAELEETIERVSAVTSK